jgi:lysylphosphatidylglycerol synthetase-like protein (DUF2156 family)
VNAESRSDRWVHPAQGLFFLNAAIWLGFAVWTVVRPGGIGPVSAAAGWVVAMLMVGNAVAMLLSGLGIGTRRRLFYVFALLVLAVNIVLTFADEFGVFDAATLLIDVALLGLLIAARRRYTR